ncbi:MAG: NADH-quinone oxidoreductase subunit C [Myxococcota bacterium]
MTETVARDAVLEHARALLDAGFDYLVYCATFHEPAKDERPDRVVVEYRVRKLPKEEAAFRVEVPTGETTPTLTGVWAGAEWQEREQFDLVGVVFAGHPDLRRIMLPEDWVGHPLRRDYAIDTRHAPWR